MTTECRHEPLIPDNPYEREVGGMVAVDDVRQGLPVPTTAYAPCKHCGAPLHLRRDDRLRVSRSWLIEHGYNDPFAADTAD